MKSIEAGCLAIIIDSGIPECGKIVTVIKEIKAPNDYVQIKCEKTWLIDRFITQLYEDLQFAEFLDMATSDQLLRIDGESFTEDKESMEIEQ